MEKHLTLGLLMMVRNEEKRIRVSLESIKNIVNELVFYDTGSTDKTMEIIENFAKENNLPLHLLRGTFTDFSTSRNESLDFADKFENIDILLLLDCNDELRGGKELREFVNKLNNKEHKDETYWEVCQTWMPDLSPYYNPRLIRPRCGLRYRGAVHEWLGQFGSIKGKCGTTPKEVVLFQDRTKDDDKTSKRFTRDKDLLLAELKKSPMETRTLFYLAQTYMCLGDAENAFYYYKLRTSVQGFYEERFHAYMKCGDLAQGLGHPIEEIIKWWLLAFTFLARAEPLCAISDYYMNHTRDWNSVYMYAHMASLLSYPTDAKLWVDKKSYDCKRWMLLSASSFYVGQFEEGKRASEICLKNGFDFPNVKSNLKLYEEKIKEIEKSKKEEKDEEDISWNDEKKK